MAWRLEAVDPGAGGHRRRLDLPMVGRDSSSHCCAGARAHRGAQRPHAVTVLGQPGIGKSRLIAEIDDRRPDLTVLTGHCRATTGSSSLAPLLEAARSAIPAGTIQVRRSRTPWAAIPRPPPWRRAWIRRGAAGSADVAWAVSRLISTMAAAGTVVLVLEDVHWADDFLLDVVEQLLGRNRRLSLAVVCTARPEFAEHRPGWGAGSNATTVVLERLDDVQTLRLLTHAGPGLTSEQAEQVIAAAEGNPLFAEHLAALLGDHTASVGLPRSIQVLLSARWRRCPSPSARS